MGGQNYSTFVRFLAIETEWRIKKWKLRLINIIKEKYSTYYVITFLTIFLIERTLSNQFVPRPTLNV